MTYNNADLVYESKNNSKSFSNIYNGQSTSKCKNLKCNYHNKDWQIAVLCFYPKKSHENKQGHPPLHFYKEHCERKTKKCLLIICIPPTSKN